LTLPSGGGKLALEDGEAARLHTGDPVSPRDRFLAAVGHRFVSPVPLDYLGSAPVDALLRQHLGVADNDQLRDRLGACIRTVGADFNMGHPACRAYHESLPPGVIPHPFGPWSRPGPPDGYGDPQQEKVYRLTGDITEKDVEDMVVPKPDWYDYNDLVNRCRRYDGCARLLNAGSYMLLSTAFRPMDEVFTDFVLNPGVAHVLLGKIHALMKGFAEAALEAAKGQIEIVRVGSDLGTQKGLLLSPDTFREFFFPRIREMGDLVHRHGAKLFFHSCGAVSELIPQLIEAGVDILDPVQPVAGMEPEKLKREFGRHLTFHGGVDTQDLMLNAPPARVKAEVERLSRIFGEGGGYILCPSNNFMSGTPLENLLAFYGLD
jgi:uroporphyrinogen decarboxylase